VCHAASNKTGFVKDSKLIFQFKGKQVNSDYHSEMNTELNSGRVVSCCESY
jgi:hypothetical protein